MIDLSADSFDPGPILGGLKDFQRATVDHAIDRMYAAHDPSLKFLVADEVGLGKTLIARGVIARSLEKLWTDVERIDVIYICSNRSIADQNIRRLNIFGDQGFSFSSRMTMVAREVKGLRNNKVNFVSFTPGTSFDLKSSLGVADERVLLWYALRRIWGREVMDGDGARRILQGWLSSLDRFDELLGWSKSWANELDRELLDRFGAELANTHLRDRFVGLAAQLESSDDVSDDASAERGLLVGELRNRLASQCVSALEPDLVILDEFQRFRDLLTDDSEAGRLANDLFGYEGNRTLLLSATPYKMYTVSGDDDDDHHRDFLRTVEFLLGEDAHRFSDALHRYQGVLLDAGQVGPSVIADARRRLERELTRVMVRTERLAADETRSGMLREVVSQIDGLTSDDVRSYVALERLSRQLDAGSMTEYWKSAPYFLNFTDGYKLDGRLVDALADPTRRNETATLIGHVGAQVDWGSWRRYEALDPGNARLRHLMSETTGAARWRMLWLAPSLPYYELDGPWAEPGAGDFTKRLIFSSWGAVPKAIASVLSYDAERQMMSLRDEVPVNDPEERKKIKGPLQYRRNADGDPAAMSTFGLMYPSYVLADVGDPLTIERSDELPTQAEVLEVVRSRVERLLEQLPEGPSEGRVDDAWYWAAPILLDLHDGRDKRMRHKRLYTYAWLGGQSGDDPDDPDSSFHDHVRLAHEVARGKRPLGRRPDDLAEILTLHALGNPATLALRALRRVLPEADDQDRWDGACRISAGFRTLFNLPEASTMVRATVPGDYWRAVLHYCADGCLGAVLDEYVHCLREWLGLVDVSSWKDVHRIAEECADAVSLKSADYVAKDHLRVSGAAEHRFRSRFALRLGNERSESDATVIRIGNVRTSFNSPFWPFVLASTSIGQEGLDFHLYCHAIVHWNLPSNPVDLEQREGRVHRYKGHAVRRNVAAAHADAAWRSADGDPWRAMFDAAAAANSDSTDLIPYWIYPGPFAIERSVLALPMSREVSQLHHLKRSVALYRLVFGQARQDDLIEYLAGIDDPAILDAFRIDLSPLSRSGA